jgi:hypothetical protein
MLGDQAKKLLHDGQQPAWSLAAMPVAARLLTWKPAVVATCPISSSIP